MSRELESEAESPSPEADNPRIATIIQHLSFQHDVLQWRKMLAFDIAVWKEHDMDVTRMSALADRVADIAAALPYEVENPEEMRFVPLSREGLEAAMSVVLQAKQSHEVAASLGIEGDDLDMLRETTQAEIKVVHDMLLEKMALHERKVATGEVYRHVAAIANRPRTGNGRAS